MNCQRRDCSECGDRLIHQSNRGPKESSSLFGQWVYDKVPHQFDFVDLDGIVFRRSTRVLYLVEEKHGGSLSQAQQTLLPILGRGIELLIADGTIHPESRVLYLRAQYNATDLEKATVFPHDDHYSLGKLPTLSGSELAELFTGRRFLEKPA